ncbi:MAG: RNA polymerase sporulation sigma factor SigG [Clostridia bacterium]|jgi:RNA polymerase sporulation-specific sigma factor|nr:RNA polymerase sporulation sigma factor SigG [Clostridia bacterium]
MNKVEISGVNTSKLPLLTAEEKVELLKKVQQGDKIARETFINGNLRLVLSIIKRFYARGENLDDLFQVGCVGLIKAMDNFDMEQNVQFSTYAVPMIIGEIKRYLRDNNSIRVSRSVREIAYKALAIQDRIRKEENRDARIEEIAKELKINKEEIAMSLDAIQEPISLQEPAYMDSNDTINVMDQISDKKNTDEMWTESLTIAQLMRNLNEKEKSIISKRYFEGRTQMEIADEIGISQAQVSRLEKDAIKHMRRLYK